MTLLDRRLDASVPLERVVVDRVHAAVGEALAARHGADEAAGRLRLERDDEEALAEALVVDELRRLRAEALGGGRVPLEAPAEAAMRSAVMDRLFGLAGIQPHLDDPEVRDIHISGAGPVWLARRDGTKVQAPPVVASDAELVELVATAARRMGRSERRWDHAHPELNLRLPNGDRLHALMAVTGRPVVTIRRHDFSALSRVAHLVDSGLFSIAIGAFLVAVVRARLSLIVAGGTGTGKTTSLRCLINEIPPGERLLTVEDSLELGLEHFEDLHPDYEAIEAREANTEGQGAFTLADGVRAGLRMNPDRVIVGEIRGGGELLSMLLAMSQGNDGSMCSLHADSSAGVFSRLAMYAAMTPERLAPDVTARLVAEAVQVVVHLGWVDGVRRVTSIREVTGVSDAGQVASNEVWRPGSDGRAVPHMPLSQPTLARLVEAGFDARLLRAEGGWRR